MVWSLSQDDDGLEPVSQPSSSLSASREQGQSAPGPASSVVVDPRSQLPPDAAREFALAAMEPTEVLHGRTVDELRAQVERQRRAYQRRASGRLLLWGVAGAIAVGCGVMAARWTMKPPAGERGEPEGEAAEREARALRGAAPPPPAPGDASSDLAEPHEPAPATLDDLAPVRGASQRSSHDEPVQADAPAVTLDELLGE